MKYRMGFVSNSSSCSFCVYGVYIDEKRYYDVWKNIDSKELLKEAEIEDHGNPNYWSGCIMVGRSFANIKDNETGLEFKTKVENVLKKLFGDDIKCGVYEEGWYDG